MTTRLLLISDQSPSSDHSAVEGLFAKELSSFIDVSIVYFDREAHHSSVEGHRIIVPHAARRRRLVQHLPRESGLETFDIVVVRNLFPVLKAVLKARRSHCFRLGFWESFPHSYRRVVQAQQTNRAQLRTRLEYAIVQRHERSLVGKCDFYLPISETLRETLRPDLHIPWKAVGLGIQPQLLPSVDYIKRPSGEPLHFIYAGAIDVLRRMHEVCKIFASRSEPFRLDLYSRDQNEACREIWSCGDPRIRFHGPLPRSELFTRIVMSDVGLSMIPEIPLYAVSSPTKSMEYAAVGLPSLMSKLPEHLRLFDDGSAFLCHFERSAIQESLNRIFSTSRESLVSMGRRAREIVLQRRNYSIEAESVAAFLLDQAKPPPQRSGTGETHSHPSRHGEALQKMRSGEQIAS